MTEEFYFARLVHSKDMSQVFLVETQSLDNRIYMRMSRGGNNLKCLFLTFYRLNTRLVSSSVYTCHSIYEFI